MTDWSALATELLRQERETDTPERRLAERTETAARARVVADRAGSRTVALVKDVSLTGAGLLLGVGLTPGQFFVLELLAPARVQHILCKVVYCREIDAGMYRIGAEFFEELPTGSEGSAPPTDWLTFLP